MTIDPSEAATSLQDIANIEQRTREALFYSGSSAIFILWGALVAVGYGLTGLYPRSAQTIWLAVPAVGAVATVAIVAMRRRACAGERRDWRVIWAMTLLMAFGATWSYLLGRLAPPPLMYAFQPSLALVAVILLGLWLGRSFVLLGVAGLVLIAFGYLQDEPWMRLWMAAVQSGTFIVGGIWLGRIGVPR
jgi:hypothetical protein